MTSPETQPPAPEPSSRPDRVHRSSAGIAGGVVLLALVAWLGIDALVVGKGRTPWLALAAMIVIVPLVSAFTLRPAVFVNDDRLRVRNPFRVIVLPWGSVASLRSGYSNEVVATSGTKYQLWAVPVSLRGRKRAARHEARQTAEGIGGAGVGRGGPGRRGGMLGGLGGGFGGRGAGAGAGTEGPVRAQTDQIMDDLKEFAERRGGAEAAQGEPSVRWAYEVLGPVAAGLIVFAVLLATG
ncbi:MULTISPECIES: PH domain-containing protein [unclassified Streptomyces]|uniref:PH domain-containing protein n=1 Tax=unclassified Streptomyces TaxID=2593676 RepID=UPI0004BE9CEC|nr:MULTISPECIES: PH domain-containing protein [unclassified Streptomyces]